MSPHMWGRVRFEAPTALVERPAPADRSWHIQRDRAIGYRSTQVELEVSVPRGNSTVARCGQRTLMLLGGGPLAETETAQPFEAFCDALDRDSCAALRTLRAPFILLYIDVAARRLMFATDRVATRSPCYSIEGTTAVVGLSAADIVKALTRPPEIRPQGIFEYIYFHAIPAPGTIFERVRRLLPGEVLHVEGAQAQTQTYWAPSYAPSSIDLAGAKTEFRSLLRQAVASQLDRETIGTFLSGGTDSSTVAGTLGDVSGRAARTYSIGFNVDGYDEMRYARIASAHFRTEHHEYYLTPSDLVSGIPAVATSFDQPFGNSSAVAAFFCAQMAAANGITKLLAGDGGDELFGGNTRYARQQLFDVYGVAPAWLRRAAEATLRTQFAGRIPWVRKARSYVEQARVSMPTRMHTYNLVDHVGTATMFQSDFLAAIDAQAPARFREAYYARCTDPSIINRMLHYDWKFTLADNDLPKVVGACDLAGIDVGFPLLDERIAEFANHLPANWKVRRLKLRYFFKAALKDFLPAAIIRKEKHGFGLPFGHWLVTDRALREMASGNLESLRDRGIVRPAFFAELLDRVNTHHAGFYGELVWILMMLELWLAAHRPGYRFT